MQLAGFDVETGGVRREYALQPFRAVTGQAWLTSWAIATLPRGTNEPRLWGRSLPTHDVMLNRTHAMPGIRSFLRRCAEQKIRIVGWNTPFDVAWLIAIGLRDEVFACEWLDTMLLYRHVTASPEWTGLAPPSYGLKPAVALFYPEHAGYGDDVDFEDNSPEMVAKRLTYNKLDSKFALELAHKFIGMLTPEQLRAALIEAACIPMVAETLVEGIAADAGRAVTLSAELEATARIAFVKLKMEEGLITPELLASPKQLRELIYGKWGLPVVKMTKPTPTNPVGNASTDKDALDLLGVDDPRAKLLHAYREAVNNRTKFSQGVVNSLAYNGDGRVRPAFRIFGTYCVPGDVEVLTRTDGWQPLRVWAGGEIAQVRPDHSLGFLPATRFVGPQVDEWVAVRHPQLVCDFTPGHTVPYLKQKSKLWATMPAEDLLERHHIDVPISGQLAGLSGTLSPSQMRVLCMAQADGWFATGDRGYLKLTLKKERKVLRAKALLATAGVPFRARTWPSYPDRTEIIVNKSDLPSWLSADCKQLGPWLLNTTVAGLQAFLDELVYWDGSPHADGGMKYTSSIRANAEWVQTCAHLLGRKAGIHAPEQQLSGTPTHTVHISDAMQRAIRTVSRRKHVSRISCHQQAFCAITETGFWLARSHGTIFVTGNTGRGTYSSRQRQKGTPAVKAVKGVSPRVPAVPGVEFPTGVALHQWKRGDGYRGLIVAPEGYDLMEWDFAGQEFRWMAVESGDTKMLELCAPGEDAHAYMGGKMGGLSYAEMQAKKEIDADAKRYRQLGKVGNLSCIAEGQRVLTDRGQIPIEDVTVQDQLWDGCAWVRHDGLLFQGVRDVITYQGVTATGDHKVWVGEQWVTLQEAADHNWRIAPALGEGWSCRTRSGVRIVGGVVRRALSTVWRTVRDVPLSLRAGEGGQPADDGGGPLDHVQGLRHDIETPRQRPTGGRYAGEEAAAKEGGGDEAAVREPSRRVVQELRRAWHRVQVLIREGVRGVYVVGATVSLVCGARHRQEGQQRPLRAGQPAAAVSKAEHRQQKTFDLLNAGPRSRFSVGACIVSNCQYRTGADTLRDVARVQHRVTLSEIEAKALWSTYRLTYRRMPEYWKRQIYNAKLHGYVETQAGRRIHVGTGDTWPENQKWGRESTAINFPIQGVGADQKYLAMRLLRDYLPRVDGRLYFELHDGLFAIAPKAKSERCAVEVKKLLSNLPYKAAWGKVFPVEFPVDAKRGPSWGELKGVA